MTFIGGCSQDFARIYTSLGLGKGEFLNHPRSARRGLGGRTEVLTLTAETIASLQAFRKRHADAQRIDQGVAGVGLVEDGLAADVRQAQAVAVAADAGDDAEPTAEELAAIEAAERADEAADAGEENE